MAAASPEQLCHPPLKAARRYKYDHDMFSILANKYGNEFKGWQPPEKIGNYSQTVLNYLPT
jgi:hypothetical protein